ncbi:pyridoxal-phosphate dependent enzyme [Candidatus Protochlamydia phocaeensis]|uniref:pyridoxal-phosphate dependent enzyme n=1 Tax=Candidatus Protochlamydia phocaeensis TaxID=1414722 RepID=UPI0008396D1A|nr:pyridoxal-phosphate dependent enzyme [Candidatus Protochlamydia phocaeensis]
MAMASIKSYIKKTPLIRCKELEKELKSTYKVFLKLENEQLTKSFKIRGAFNALLALKDSEKIKGIITRSSGNFAQAYNHLDVIKGQGGNKKRLFELSRGKN